MAWIDQAGDIARFQLLVWVDSGKAIREGYQSVSWQIQAVVMRWVDVAHKVIVCIEDLRVLCPKLHGFYQGLRMGNSP